MRLIQGLDRAASIALLVGEEFWLSLMVHLKGVEWVCPDCRFTQLGTPERWQYCRDCLIETGRRVTMKRKS